MIRERLLKPCTFLNFDPFYQVKIKCKLPSYFCLLPPILVLLLLPILVLQMQNTLPSFHFPDQLSNKGPWQCLPGIYPIQHFLALCSNHLLFQIIQHSDPQQHPTGQRHRKIEVKVHARTQKPTSSPVNTDRVLLYS